MNAASRARGVLGVGVHAPVVVDRRMQGVAEILGVVGQNAGVHAALPTDLPVTGPLAMLRHRRRKPLGPFDDRIRQIPHLRRLVSSLDDGHGELLPRGRKRADLRPPEQFPIAVLVARLGFVRLRARERPGPQVGLVAVLGDGGGVVSQHGWLTVTQRGYRNRGGLLVTSGVPRRGQSRRPEKNAGDGRESDDRASHGGSSGARVWTTAARRTMQARMLGVRQCLQFAGEGPGSVEPGRAVSPGPRQGSS